MKDWKRVCKKILFLPLWLICFFTIISAAALVAVFTKNLDTSPAAYVVYVFSFYTLMVLCIACFTIIPGYYKTIREKVYANQYANRYLTDAVYKNHVSLDISLIINLAYVATNAVSAVVYGTNWFAVFAVYYGIMAVMRFLLARYVRKNQVGEGEQRLAELRRCRVCASILLTVNLTLSGVVLMMVYYDRGFEYQGFLIYVMAMYTFYSIAAAVRDLVKYRKYNSPVMSVSKMIKLASSLFSMLFLETAMFAQFGQDTSEQTKQIMIMATGAGICVIVVGMALYMIVRSSKEIKEYKISKKEQ